MTEADERELEWWRRVFACRFVPDSLPKVGTPLYGYRLKVVEVRTGQDMDEHGRLKP